MAITLADDGERLRMRVDLAADVPTRLRDGEVAGIGVDLLDDDGESRYQLFADGGADGWEAYLQTPSGFVRYPGTFALGGRRLELVVPWRALGSPQHGPFSVFLDWSRRRDGIGVLNPVAEDHAPDRGTAHFDRGQS